MTHDPLCPQPLCDDKCMGYEDCDHHCQCRLVARVREDERGERDLLYETGLADGRLLESERAQREAHAYIGAHRDEWIKDGYAAALSDCQRFLEKVDTSGDCWMWLGSTTEDGYGHLSWDGKTERAHRVAASIFNGPIPEGAHVLHTCDQPGCVRPDHLFYGDHAMNMQDMAAKGRQSLQRNPEQGKAINANGKRKWRNPKKAVCKNGHPLTGDNVRIGKNGYGQDYQVCVTCSRERSLAAYYRRKEQS